MVYLKKNVAERYMYVRLSVLEKIPFLFNVNNMINCFDSWLKPYILSVHLNDMNEMNDSSTSVIDNKYTYTL